MAAIFLPGPTSARPPSTLVHYRAARRPLLAKILAVSWVRLSGSEIMQKTEPFHRVE